MKTQTNPINATISQVLSLPSLVKNKSRSTRSALPLPVGQNFYGCSSCDPGPTYIPQIRLRLLELLKSCS